MPANGREYTLHQGGGKKKARVNHFSKFHSKICSASYRGGERKKIWKTLGGGGGMAPSPKKLCGRKEGDERENYY